MAPLPKHSSQLPASPPDRPRCETIALEAEKATFQRSFQLAVVLLGILVALPEAHSEKSVGDHYIYKVNKTKAPIQERPRQRALEVIPPGVSCAHFTQKMFQNSSELLLKSCSARVSSGANPACRSISIPAFRLL